MGCMKVVAGDKGTVKPKYSIPEKDISHANGAAITTHRILIYVHFPNRPSPWPLHSHGRVLAPQHRDTPQLIESKHEPSHPQSMSDAWDQVPTSCEWGCDKAEDWGYWLSEGMTTRPDSDWHKLWHRQNRVGQLLVAPRATEVLGSASSNRLSRMPRYRPTARHTLPSPTAGGFKDV